MNVGNVAKRTNEKNKRKERQKEKRKPNLKVEEKHWKCRNTREWERCRMCVCVWLCVAETEAIIV